ncbi:unnamed protein product [Withania somnifera]
MGGGAWPFLVGGAICPVNSVNERDLGLLTSYAEYWRSVLGGGPGPSPLEGGAGEGESPVVPGPCRTTRRCLRVGLFGNAAQIGR